MSNFQNRDRMARLQTYKKWYQTTRFKNELNNNSKAANNCEKI